MIALLLLLAMSFRYQPLLDPHLDERVDPSTRERLVLLVVGMLRAKSAAPARIAQALQELGLTQATAESIERRIRRIENDPELEVTLCFHPFARERLLFGRPKELVLILDPTTQEDRVVMLSASGWYRGRALPLAWMVWPANQPLTGAGFWERVEMLLDTVYPFTLKVLLFPLACLRCTTEPQRTRRKP